MTRQEYKEIYDVVGAAMEVYNTLGRGMAEAIKITTVTTSLNDSNRYYGYYD
jgi:hypothetical protein